MPLSCPASKAKVLTAYELAAHIWANTTLLRWPDFRGHLRRNAINTLAAHLELLRDEGRVVRSDDLPNRYQAT